MTIKDLRLRRGMSLREAGRHAGVSGTALKNWEDGKFSPTVSMVPILASVYDVEPEEVYRMLEGGRQSEQSV